VALSQSLKKPLLATGAFTELCLVTGTDMGMDSSRQPNDPLG